MLSKTQLAVIRDIEITKNIAKNTNEKRPYNISTHNVMHNINLSQREWFRLTWELYVKSETSFYRLNEVQYQKLLFDETLDDEGNFYFALVEAMRLNEKLKPSERVMCRTIVSRNPIHSNMMYNIKNAPYTGDVICFVGPYKTKEEANHQLTEHRKTIGKIQLMIRIAREEGKQLKWFMIPPNLFASRNAHTMFLPDTIDGFGHCCGIFQSSVAGAEDRSTQSIPP